MNLIANSGDGFDFSEEPKKVGRDGTESICLTKDEKYLIVRSHKLVNILETDTREVTKEFKLIYDVRGISLIKDGIQAIIAESNGNLNILDLETLKISSIAKIVTNDRYLNKITLI